MDPPELAAASPGSGDLAPLSHSAAAAKQTRKPPLHRGQACIQCKRKKRKCNGVKPVCGPCSNSSSLYQEEPACEWPDILTAALRGPDLSSLPAVGSTTGTLLTTSSSVLPPMPAANPAKRPRTSSKGEPNADPADAEVESLKARIHQLELALQQAGSPVHPTKVEHTPKLETIVFTPSSLGDLSNLSSPRTDLRGAQELFHTGQSSRNTASTPPSITTMPHTPPVTLFWLAWPPDLPNLKIVKTLCEAALSMISPMCVIAPDALLPALALSPTDLRFPSTALLHALCALGSSIVPLTEEAQSYWKSSGSPSAPVYHFRCAKKALQEFREHTVLDNIKAALLLTMYSFATEQFVEVWQLVGFAARNIAPAGLNHVQNSCALPSTKISVTPGHFLRKPTFLPQPTDDFDVFYRTTTLWQIYCCDVWMGACSGWSPALSLEDITSLLPVWPSDTSPLDIVLNQPSIDPHSQHFFTHHLQSPILPVHLVFKAMILLSKVTSFLQRSTLPTNIINTETKEGIRISKAFSDLYHLILAFQHSIPITMSNPLRSLPDGRLDANLLNAHLVPSIALLLLYEPFIMDGNDEGFKLSEATANSVYELTQSIFAHSQDQIVMYNTPINYCWMVANRTLIRAMRYKEDAGDSEGAADARIAIEFLLARITPLCSKSPLVSSCMGMLEMLIRDESPWHRG